MKRLIPWLVGLVVVTLLIGSTYLSLQQLGRQADDDVPAGLALSQLNSPDPKVLKGATPIDLAQGPETFVNVYRGDGTPLSGNGTLAGSLPRLPQGVIESALQTGQDRVTWQPRQNVRYAVVARATGDTVVVAGQNLQPSENRNQMMMLLLGLGWLGSVLTICAGYVLTVRRTDWLKVPTD